MNVLLPSDYVGFAVWFVGMCLEVVADWQKTRFNAQPENKGAPLLVPTCTRLADLGADLGANAECNGSLEIC